MTGSSETNRNGETEKDRVERIPGPLWARNLAERGNARAAEAMVARGKLEAGDRSMSMFSDLQVRFALGPRASPNLEST